MRACGFDFPLEFHFGKHNLILLQPDGPSIDISKCSCNTHAGAHTHARTVYVVCVHTALPRHEQGEAVAEKSAPAIFIVY
jgi:hypothetical protein